MMGDQFCVAQRRRLDPLVGRGVGKENVEGELERPGVLAADQRRQSVESHAVPVLTEADPAPTSIDSIRNISSRVRGVTTWCMLNRYTGPRSTCGRGGGE